VWPYHWANSGSALLRYNPAATTARHVKIKCLVGDASHERMAIAVQRQLQAIGVELELEMLPVDQLLARVQSGNFDAMLADMVQGPNLMRPYMVWHSGGPLNWGKFSSKSVDAALDAIRHAADDDEYKAGVAAFQRAIVDDPPAVFLAWSERARAVSRRFVVPSTEPGRDILGTLRLWQPANESPVASRN